MDVESINRWEDYSKAKDNMMEHTDTDFSPWYIVESDIKEIKNKLHISYS